MNYIYSRIRRKYGYFCYRLQELTLYAILPLNMKIFEIFKKEEKSKARKVSDYYQASLDKFGRDQIKKLVEKGLSIPVAIL